MQIVVRRANQREIDRIGAAAAERRDRFLLQHPQQARLQARRHVADFIEEQHAAIRLTDLADIAFGVGAGKRPRRIAEQFGLDQRFRQRRAVDRHEVAVAPATFLKQAAAEVLLAAAGFAGHAQRKAGVENTQRFLMLLVVPFRRRRRTQSANAALGRLEQRIIVPLIAGQRLARRAGGLPQQIGEQLSEFKRAECGRRELELDHRQPIGGDQHFVVKHQQQFLRAAQAASVGVQAQRPVTIGDRASDPAVFDMAHRLHDQTLRIRIRALGRGREIQYAGNMAIRPVDRRGGAVQSGVLVEKMLIAAHFAESAQRQRSADGVGAPLRFSPLVARRQRKSRRLVQKIVIATGFQHQPVGVGDHHDGRLTRNLRAQLFDQRLYPLRHPVVAAAQFFEQTGFDKRDMLIGARQAVTAAALPGFRQRVGQQTGALSEQAIVRQHAFLPRLQVLQICIMDVYQALRHGTQKIIGGSGTARLAYPHQCLTF